MNIYLYLTSYVNISELNICVKALLTYVSFFKHLIKAKMALMLVVSLFITFGFLWF